MIGLEVSLVFSFDTRACTCIAEGDSYDMVTDFSQWINGWTGNPEPIGTVMFDDTATDVSEVSEVYGHFTYKKY